MARKSTLELYVAADQDVIVDVLQSDEVTPQAMTGWTLGFVVRDTAGNLLFSKASPANIAIGNGAATNDRATTAVALADIPTGTGIGHEWALWRTDSGDRTLLAWGPVNFIEAPIPV